MRANEWHEMSMARAKPSRELSTTRPCRSLLGANAIECSTKSRRPQRSLMDSNTASSWLGCSTSRGNTMLAASCCASGSTKDFALSLSHVTASSAPAARSPRRYCARWRCRQQGPVFLVMKLQTYSRPFNVVLRQRKGVKVHHAPAHAVSIPFLV